MLKEVEQKYVLSRGIYVTKVTTSKAHFSLKQTLYRSNSRPSLD